jgi:hypothetical protein
MSLPDAAKVPGSPGGARGLRAARLLVVLLVMNVAACDRRPDESAPVVRFDEARGVFLLEGNPGAAQLTAEQQAELFPVSVDAPDVPALLGRYGVENGALVFTPQYPIQAGVRYKATAHIPGMAPVSAVADIPKKTIVPSTVVADVYPSLGVLPENQLKFYIHFSNSMSQGDAFLHIALLDESGARIPDPPFLVRGGELWDRDFKRFTLFFDPGRVKRDLGPSLEMGPALREGKRYTLLIDRDWVDAEGAPLKEEFRKTFTVGPPDRKPIDLDACKISRPKSGTLDPAVIDFPEPMDHAIVLRELDVLDPSGKAVEGNFSLERNETRWQMTPSAPWKKGAYTIEIGTVTADLAGNMVGRPFEVDLFEKVDERLTRQTHELRFKID